MLPFGQTGHAYSPSSNLSVLHLKTARKSAIISIEKSTFKRVRDRERRVGEGGRGRKKIPTLGKQNFINPSKFGKLKIQNNNFTLKITF